jgi:hypothetical protein
LVAVVTLALGAGIVARVSHTQAPLSGTLPGTDGAPGSPSFAGVDYTSAPVRQVAGLAVDESTERAKSETADEAVAQIVKTLGSRAAEPIQQPEMILFWEGRFVPDPYQLRRDGYSLYLNEAEVFRHPSAPNSYQKVLPPVPKGVTRDSSWKDIERHHVDGKQWHVARMQYFSSHFGPDERVARLVEDVKSLPFVNEVEWVPWQGKEYLRVVTHAGDERHFFTSWWDPDRRSEFDTVYDSLPDTTPYRAEVVKDRLEEQIGAYEQLLSLPKLLIVSSAGVVGCESRDSEKIAHTMDILASERSQRAKVYGLYYLLVDEVDRADEARVWLDRTSQWMTIKQLVANFQTHAQLEERVAAVRGSVEVAQWTPAAEKPLPALPENLRNDPRLTPEGSVREALRLLAAGDNKAIVDGYLVQPKDPTARRMTVELFNKGGHRERLLQLLQNARGKKAVVDAVDLTATISIDDSGSNARSTPANVVRLRRVGHLWQIGS